jgi:hypothetical protein
VTPRVLRRSCALLTSVVEDPFEVLLKLEDRVAEWREPPAGAYDVDDDWEERLHDLIGARWPCPERQEFDSVWADLMALLRSKGINVGRGAFGGWGDGDPAFARAGWCLTLHLRPAAVVETGVARGVTTRVILQALARNEVGRLWSVDLPPPRDRHLHDQIGAAVPEELRDRWTYVPGSSRRRLPGLLTQLGAIDIFLHDSRHSARNVLFELEHAWSALRPSGVLLVDDIDVNEGFRSFCATHALGNSLVGRAEPAEPDVVRQDGTGVFGITLRPSSAAAPLQSG